VDAGPQPDGGEVRAGPRDHGAVPRRGRRRRRAGATSTSESAPVRCPKTWTVGVLEIEGHEIGLAAALTAAGLTASNSEAFREIRQRAVRVDGERVEDQRMTLKAGGTYVLAVGKRRIVEVRTAQHVTDQAKKSGPGGAHALQEI
jgi:hypothetical protein